MKIFYFIAYVYHRLFRFIYRKEGNWQSKDFENHHQKMKKYKGLLAIIAIVLFLFTQSTTADFMSEEDKTVQVADSLLQSTVIIIVKDGGGSGFYISPTEIITNHHVVKDAKSVFIKKSNGAMCLADVIFTQSNTDLALIKTDCEGKPIPLAESVKVGQSVLAMGDPMYYEFYVSKGIVGIMEDGEIVHDAVIDKGMSGGPVVNLNGQLVGVTYASSAVVPKMSFAIDIKTLSYFMYQAKEVK